MKKVKGKKSKSNSGGLRKRWLKNTLSVVTILGVACVLAVTSYFYAYYYNTLKTDMRFQAQTATDFFSDFRNQSYEEYGQSCIRYARTFDGRNSLELQFIDREGSLEASSFGQWAGDFTATREVQEAMNTRGISTFVGRNPDTGERIIAVSSPMIYSDGQVAGVLRYVTSTKVVDRLTFQVAFYSVLICAAVIATVLLSSEYYIRSILIPVADITEKTKKIASGSYGVQIQTKYDDEIGELAENINEMSSKISQNEKMQAEFISSLSHELRTPLTAINGWSETLLSSDDLTPDAQRGMRIIASEAKRLTEMVVDLLDFTRIQDGRMTLNVETADIRAEYEDTIYMYSSRLRQEGITLECEDSDDDIPEIPCDPKRMRQVFLNILDNAAKHGGTGKKIDTSIHLEDDCVVVRIRDYGPGIPEDEIPLVKKKFYKGSSKARGTGIGLAVCDEIVEMHGGTLTLENAEGGGTLVTITLPCA